MKVVVLTPVEHDHVVYGLGDVLELDDKQAKALVDAKAARVKEEPKEAPKDDKQAKAK